MATKLITKTCTVSLMLIILVALISGCQLTSTDEMNSTNGTILEDELSDADGVQTDADEGIEELQDVTSGEGTNVTLDNLDQANITHAPVEVSGSLELQEDHSLCPHLTSTFSCNKYDLRYCDYETLIAKDGFRPGVLNCVEEKEPESGISGTKTCLIQECRPLTEGNIVYAYGGNAANAKYITSKTAFEGGILITHELESCGETTLEFETEEECRYYRSVSGVLSEPTR